MLNIHKAFQTNFIVIQYNMTEFVAKIPLSVTKLEKSKWQARSEIVCLLALLTYYVNNFHSQIVPNIVVCLH